MKKKVIVLIKGTLEQHVPTRSVIVALRRQGYPVLAIASDVGAKARAEFEQMGVEVYAACPDYPKGSSILGKVRHALTLRWNAWRRIREEGDFAFLWLGSAEIALALGRGVFRHPYVLHIRELYDEFPGKLRQLAPYARRAGKVVVAEACRGAIMRTWWRLEETPVVLANKPIWHPRTPAMPISDPKARQIIEGLEGQKIILYQGWIAMDRDLGNVARALGLCREKYCLVVMGKELDDSLAKLREIHANTIHVPYLSPPGHLEVTSHAHMAIATYEYTNLNNIFCAPNKIYEYAGFGIPTLARDIPGLTQTVGAYGAGACVAMETPESIARGLDAIEAAHASMRAGSNRLFDETDTEAVLRDVFEGMSACR